MKKNLWNKDELIDKILLYVFRSGIGEDSLKAAFSLNLWFFQVSATYTQIMRFFLAWADCRW